MPKKIKYLILIVAAFGLFTIFQIRSNEDIYEAMLGKQPKSVVVFHSEDQAFLDCCIWLHFRIDKKDLIPMLDTLETASADLHRWNNVDAPEWWKPDLLGENIEFYKWQSQYHKRERNFYVSRKMNEVYFVDQSGH